MVEEHPLLLESTTSKLLKNKVKIYTIVTKVFCRAAQRHLIGRHVHGIDEGTTVLPKTGKKNQNTTSTHVAESDLKFSNFQPSHNVNFATYKSHSFDTKINSKRLKISQNTH